MFSPLDWVVLAAYLAGTTWLASRLAGRQQTIRDFFLGGRRLPGWAVCGSIVASEVSGVTFVSVPAIAFAAGGDYTYLMLATGTILARVVIGFWFVPAFYRGEIYSPYEFMRERLGPGAGHAGTAIFLVGGMLAQGTRLFLAGLVLDAITGIGIPAAVVAIGAVSIVWTWIGGITSVVWTDVIQFVILFVGALATLGAVIIAVPGGAQEILDAGRETGKFRLWDLSTDPTKEFTLWCGIFGSTFLTLGSHGTDQMMAQRLFCCRDARTARRAVIASSVGVLLAVVMLTVGVGLHAYFLAFPMTAAEAARVADRGDYVLPLFLLRAMPAGVRGLLFASIFSAATITSTLSAMAQVAMPYVGRAGDGRGHGEIGRSRLLIAVAAALLCAVAVGCSRLRQYPDILRLAQSMAAYTYGAMLGMFLLALLPVRRDARGLAWGVPSALLLVFAFQWQQVAWVPWAITGAVAVLGALATSRLRREPGPLAAALAAGALVLAIAWMRPVYTPAGPAPLKIAFPWLFPAGCAVTMALGYAIGRPRGAALDAAAADG